MGLAMAVAVAACAQAPDKIAPAYNDGLSYTSYSCEELAAERGRIQSQLVNISRKQKRTRSGDMIGVFLIGVPVSSVGGNDRAEEIAALKGQIYAMDQEGEIRGCPPGTNLAGA